RPSRTTTLFPYTTLFRSVHAAVGAMGLGVKGVEPELHAVVGTPLERAQEAVAVAVAGHVHRAAQARDQRFTDLRGGQARVVGQRSEEHTSELQSRENLVC